MAFADDVASPCNNTCILDPETRFCRGCYRAAAEITGWTEYSAENKLESLKRAQQRRIAAAARAGK
ncbi:MAG: DUF1289 domain-containing protein [Betaproteobacteria bacterium]|nr:DUF1289 domain-containing protein [Betaproteobacteria bacterium]MDH3437567.1 DUF1289 domain-containing protein [Betaproteobacteria bacterium]